jgi:RHS repeat-associated protein
LNTLQENGIELTYTYGPDQSRYKGIWKNNGTQYRKRIYASGYEINEETVNGVSTTQNISYVSSPGGLCAIYVEENGSGTFYFVHTDHLGSITAVTNANGNVIARQNFDAWGRRRKVQDYSYLPQNTSSTDNGLNNSGTLPKWLYRGYTGHEMLDEFALINMNARLYDPVVGMFLSPDNYIQAPGNTQNYNRYAYCLNNPLKYTDPSGNLIQLAVIRGGIDAIVNRDLSQADPFKSGTAGNNAIKIWHGFFTSPEFIHQLPQNIVGMIFSHVANLFGNVQSVNYYDKSVVVKGNNDDLLWGWHKAGPAMTVGNFVIGDRTIEANPYNPLFQHEFGHVLQSREMHWGYLSTVAIPSLLSKNGDDFKIPYREHGFHPVEQDANRRAFLHFNSKEEGFYEKNGWANSENKFDVDGDFKRDIIDFKNSNDLEKLNEIKLNSLWVDRVGYWMIGRPPIIAGLLYAHYYNNYYEP